MASIIYNDVVGGKFRVGLKIGSGAFGEIREGVNIDNGERVAIKLESVETEHPQLPHESEIYEYLQGGAGIPSFKWFGEERDHYILVIELLGQSLAELLVTCRRKFSIKTVIMLADQLIDTVEYMHKKGVVHCDIKPENILMGLGKKAHQVYIVDFGLVDMYIDRDTNKHIPCWKSECFIGTELYAGVFTHVGYEKDKELKNQKLYEKKYGSRMWLRKGYPKNFTNFIECCMLLAFDQDPDYDHLRTLLLVVFFGEGFDFEYDWSDWTVILRNKPKFGKKPQQIWANRHLRDRIEEHVDFYKFCAGLTNEGRCQTGKR